jgi:transposase
MVFVPRTRPPYPPEFRREAVALVRREGRSVPDVAEALGCSQQSLRTWLKREQLDAGERGDGLTSAERDELRELRKKVRRLEQEREILKRAAAFFARETETR